MNAYTFASYRIKNPSSVITGVNIKKEDKDELKKLYTKLSGGIYYQTLEKVLTEVDEN